jgi:hypothetical protein
MTQLRWDGTALRLRQLPTEDGFGSGSSPALQSVTVGGGPPTVARSTSATAPRVTRTHAAFWRAASGLRECCVAAVRALRIEANMLLQP